MSFILLCFARQESGWSCLVLILLLFPALPEELACAHLRLGYHLDLPEEGIWPDLNSVPVLLFCVGRRANHNRAGIPNWPLRVRHGTPDIYGLCVCVFVCVRACVAV